MLESETQFGIGLRVRLHARLIGQPKKEDYADRTRDEKQELVGVRTKSPAMLSTGVLSMQQFVGHT
jgi:hypothetical protein